MQLLRAHPKESGMPLRKNSRKTDTANAPYGHYYKLKEKRMNRDETYAFSLLFEFMA